MRKRILIAVCLAALALTAGVFYGAREVLLHGFSTIESEQASVGIERVRNSLQTDVDQLSTTTADYLLWNDPTNFTRETLDTLRVQLVWTTDIEGRTVVALTSRDVPPGVLTSISPEVMGVLRRSLPLLLSSEARPRFVRLPDGVLAFAALRAVRMDRAGIARGTLILGRYLDEALIARLAQTSQSPVRLTLLDAKGKPVGPVPRAVTDWLSSGSASEELIESDGAKVLGSHALLRDIEGRPLAVLSTSMRRDALMLGERTITYVVAVLLVCFALLLVWLLSLLDRSFRTRVAVQRGWLDQQRKIARLARRDVLTGLPNRLHLQRQLPRLIDRASRNGTRLALLYMDLDHFKNVNDSLGHGSGDRLLTTIARRLRASVAAHDVVLRMGGDEFLVVATLLPEAEVVNSIADRIRTVLQVPLDVDGVSLSITPSIGISVYPEDGADAEQLLKHADIALYHAKAHGRGHHEFYTPEMNARLRERLWLERALKEALESEELSIEYQPCFDLETRRPVSLEALLRWRTADGALVPPSRFVPVAEESALIIQIGDWVLRRVCEQLAEWQRAQVPLVPVSVNISVRQLEHTQLAARVAALAQEVGIDSSLLHFEITESAAMQNSQQYLSSLQGLRGLGARILIDDFGTGYSSLSYLKHLPVDTLKVDRAFVRDMAHDANDAAIVRAIAAVSKSLGLQLVAEGIESAEQLECLRRLDCECGQGFFLSPPVSAEVCARILGQPRSVRSPVDPRQRRALNPTT